MPTYTYRCLHCQATQALSHGMMDDPRPACMVCGGLTERVVGQLPVILRTHSENPAGEHDPHAEGEGTPSETHECHSSCAMHRSVAELVSDPKPENPT
jgi:putative FmdB family regulatory protein